MFFQNSPPCYGRPEWPYTHSLVSLSWTRLWSTCRLASLLWLWFQSLYSLMPSLSAYRLSGVSFTLDMMYLLTTTIPDLGHGVSPLGRSLLQRCTGKTLSSTMVFLIAFLSSPSLWKFSVMQGCSPAPKPWNLFPCSLSLSLCQALVGPATFDRTREGTGWIRTMATPTVT